MKTPEEIAEEWAFAYKAFLADYQAAMNSPEKPDTCEHILDMEKMVDADKVKFCVYCNDTHKGNCAIGKGKNHPAFGFSEIVVKIESSWVSVKDRLPKDGQSCIYVIHIPKKNEWKLDYGEWQAEENVFYGEYIDYRDLSWTLTHWMPLPELPEE